MPSTDLLAVNESSVPHRTTFVALDVQAVDEDQQAVAIKVFNKSQALTAETVFLLAQNVVVRFCSGGSAATIFLAHLDTLSCSDGRVGSRRCQRQLKLLKQIGRAHV